MRRVCDASGMRGRTILLTVIVAVGCKTKVDTNPKGAVGPQTVLAQVDDITITTADLKDLLARYASQPFVLARYSSIEKKKELLDSLIRYQVLAIEARKRGYERDPEVQRVAKDKMVKLFTQQEIIDKVKLGDVTDAEAEKYYKEHTADYVRPETVRVSEIVVKDRGKAQKVLSAARGLPKSDAKGFRDLVAKESEDADSKQRGGDLTQFDRASTHYPAAIVAAAFALKAIGDISDPVATDKGFAILRLTERNPALSRGFAEVKVEIQKRLLEDLRSKRKKEFVEEARKTVKVEIFEDELAKLDLAATAGMPVPPIVAPRTGLDGGVMGGHRP
jgi:peptidyl-prolyl cis-trans isomerase C